VKGRGAIAGVVLVVAAALVCASPAAAASPASPLLPAGPALLKQGATPFAVPHTGPLAVLSFRNHDGYTIAVTAFEQTVSLSVTREGHDPARPASTTTYLAHGAVTPSSIRASFADRGRIDVRFRPGGAALRAKPGSGCGARHGVIARLGRFVGDIRFQGEGGYTSAHVHRARGGTIDIAALFSCALAGVASGGHGAKAAAALRAGLAASGDGAAGARLLGSTAPGTGTDPGAGPRSTTLLADRKLPLGRTIFSAERSGSGPALFLAVDERSEGSIAIVHHALVPGPASAFSFAASLDSAAVSPPAPFSGTGSFRVGPDGAKSWEGSLAASFPGAADVPLAGPSFKPLLARSW
jgi:hypothetical protein